MKRSGVIYFSAIAVLLAATLVKSAHLHQNMPEEESVMTLTEPEPTGLNHIIVDSLSDLDETKRFERDIEQFMARWEITGASVAVMKDGNLLYSKGFGMADTAAKEPMEVRHIMRIASLSKLITATAVMKLCEQGRLQLSDKVFGRDGILSDSAFLRIRDQKILDITVEHLLRHQGGFSIAAGDPMFNADMVARQIGRKPPFDLDALVEYAASSRIRYKPGSSNIYSNLGYVVLSKVVEKASGTGYENYVKTNILDPIGCLDMHIGNSDPAMKFSNEVHYYEPSDAEPVLCYDGSGRTVPRCYGGCEISVLSGAGGWVASPTELLKFISAIDYRTGKSDLLSNASIDKMTSYNKGEYPIGWARTNATGEWQRTGSLAGTSALIKRQANGYTWVFLTNTSSWSGSKFTSKINVMMNQAIAKVKTWPQRDLFAIGSDLPQGSISYLAK